MGHCTLELHRTLLAKLKQLPYSDLIRIVSETHLGDGDYVLAHVQSVMLPAGEHGMQEIVVEYDGLRFKKAAEHGLECGSTLVPNNL